jgi:capsular polysaccharide biosynthesis protein
VESPKDLDFAGALRRRWLLVLLLTVLCAAAGYGVSTRLSPVYEGTASLLVGDFDNGDVSNNEILAMQGLAATYADIARRQPVLTGAARDLGPGTDWRQLRKSVHINVPRESPQVIEVIVEGTSRTWVIKAAGAIADRLMGFVDQTSGSGDFVTPQLRRIEEAISSGEKRVDELRAQQNAAGAAAPDSLQRDIERAQSQIAAWQTNYASFKQLASTSSHVAIRMLDEADAAPTPVKPNIRFNTVMAGFAGFLSALAIIYLLESRRRRPDPAGGRTGGYPVIVPPVLSHKSVPANGHDVKLPDWSGRTTDRNQGEVS